MEYYLKYARGVPAQTFDTPVLTELPGNMLGELVHAVIREKMDAPGRDVADLTDQFAREHEMPTHLVPLGDIEAMCMGALAYHTRQEWHEWRMEVPFVMRLDKALLHGTIDFLGRNESGWHIVDYKTDRLAAKSSAQERAKSYTLQMQAYASAATQADITPLADTTLLFLRTDNAVSQPVAPKDTTATLLTMNRILENIRTENWDAGPTPPCKTCPFHHNAMCWKDRLRP